MAQLKNVANAILQQKNRVARVVTEKYFERRPELASRWGEAGVKRCTEDTEYHLAYLAEAVRFDSPALFLDYIGWAKVLLSSLRIAETDLIENLELMRQELRKVDGETFEPADRIIELAVAAIPKMPTEPESPLKPGEPLHDVANEWVGLLLRKEAREARQLIMSSVKSGTRILEIYEHVLTPSLHEVGRLWQLRRITEAEEHYCSQVTQHVLALLSAQIAPPRNKKTALGFCVGNEPHDVGIRIVMDCFAVHGWGAVCLGANVPMRNIPSMLQQWAPDVVAISTTMTYNLAETEMIIQRVKSESGANRKQPMILVGGRPFNISPELQKVMGADFTAQSCPQVITCAPAE